MAPVNKPHKNSDDLAPFRRSDGKPGVAINLTDERKQRIATACEKMIDLLLAECQDVFEGLMVLMMVKDSLEHHYGVSEMHIFENQTEKKQ